MHHEKDLFGKILTLIFFVHPLFTRYSRRQHIFEFEIVRFYFNFKLTTNVDLLVQLEKYLSVSVINGRTEKRTNFGSHHTTQKTKG